VDTQENKLETQVYAGGALIATQVRSTTSDNVVFHTADPVTGTTMLMGDNGAYTYKEESEPLWQRIEPVDPTPGYPDEYTEITDIASEPNWNCALMKEVSGGFFNMPVECQKKEAQMMYFSIEGALQSMEPENPQRISQAPVHTHPERGPAGGDTGSSSTASSAETTMATQKPPDCDETDSGDVIRICTQVPGDDGEVTVSSGDIPGFVDASEGGMTNQTKYTNKNRDIRNAIEDVDAILRQKNDCSEFFGAYALQALGELDKTLRKGIVGSSSDTKTGIKMESSGEQPLKYRSDPVDYPNDGKGPITIQTYRVFPIGTVNSYGPFFNFQSRHRFGGYDAASRESRVAQVLHELAHMVLQRDENGNYKPLIPNDDSGDATSVINTTTILDAGCRNAIENLVNNEKK
jgi:hypothetical protein